MLMAIGFTNGTLNGHDLRQGRTSNRRVPAGGTAYLGGSMRKTVEERFWKNVRKGPGCWEWSANKNDAGYGRFWICRKGVRAHRFSLELHKGKIPEGMFVCHHCDNPGCVKPDHLFVGTQSDNMHDMQSKGRKISIYTITNKCKRGHEFTPENTYIDPDGYRGCKICRKERSREHYLKHKKKVWV